MQIIIFEIIRKGGLFVGDKKNKSVKEDKKGKPAVYNDQIGENAGEGRIINEKSKKTCK